MRVDLLDHGYVELVESWGSDERIIEAARMSTGKGFKGWGHKAFWRDDTTEDGSKPTLHPAVEGDEKLLKFLWDNKHHTPFEMAGMTIEVQAPIFVFREWHRHRTQSYNEMSARYIPLPDVNYSPTVDRCMTTSTTNKQAGTAVEDKGQLTHEAVHDWLDNLATAYAMAESVYQTGLMIGIPKEVARLPVPVGRYSRMRASANLRNWLGFLTLRTAEGAQWEIRTYAHAVANMVFEQFPRTYDLWSSK